VRAKVTDAPKQRARQAKVARIVARYAARLGAGDVRDHYLRKAFVLEEGIDNDTLISCYRYDELDLLEVKA
jgi:hypothetical protein